MENLPVPEFYMIELDKYVLVINNFTGFII